MSYDDTGLEVKEDHKLDGGMEPQHLDAKNRLRHRKTGPTGGTREGFVLKLAQAAKL